ncbi:hypothetical protein GGI05_006154, partial [Coemansia sp. RSA 2603]
MLCAFPEEGYQRVHGRSPTEATTREPISLHSLWKSCSDKKTELHARALLENTYVPSSDPIHIGLQIQSVDSGAPHTDVQSVLFRWGNLLFVCQQIRNDNSTDIALAPMHNKSVGSVGNIGGMAIDPSPSVEMDNVLLSYNLQTPVSGDSTHSNVCNTASSEPAFRLDSQQQQQQPSHPPPPSLHPHSHSQPCIPTYSGPSQHARSAGRHHQPTYIQLGSVPEARPFSIPRAPASVVANLSARPSVTLTPPDTAVPPRRQSSYTLPPVKSFEERRFSYPIQALNGEGVSNTTSNNNGRLLLPSPHPSLPPSTPATAAAAALQPSNPQGQFASPAAIGVSRGSPASGIVASPGSRLSELRQRTIFSSNVRLNGSLHPTKGMGETASTQPTPTISPLTASIVQHTPASLSPAPQTQTSSANSLGGVQVNMYPPPDTAESRRWLQGPQQPQQQQLQQYQHQLWLQKQHNPQSFSS